MKEIKTLEDALTLVPEYWPLVPGVDRWQPGDEYLNDEWYEWRNVGAAMFGRVLLTASVGHRPIPKSVREAAARWILLMAILEKRSLRLLRFMSLIDDVKPQGHARMHEEMYRCLDDDLDLFEFEDERQCVDFILEGPGALWRWVQENRK